MDFYQVVGIVFIGVGLSNLCAFLMIKISAKGQRGGMSKKEYLSAIRTLSA